MTQWTIDRNSSDVPRLPQEFKARWVAALRSGEYQQGMEWLKDYKGHFCCLGVACDLDDPNTWKRYFDDEYCTKYDSTGFPSRDDLPGDVYSVLNTKVNFYTKLGGNTVTHKHIKIMSHLACMNDDGHSFKEIAKWIEENL